MVYYLLPFAIQGIAMFFDEFYFHHKRRLKTWEIFGHPLDTMTVAVCYLFMLLNQPSELNMSIAIGLMVFSSLFITKDEFVHTAECDAAENWLHAILFILHPITFLSAFLIWKNYLDVNILKAQFVTVILFMIYQITYWGYFGKSKQ